MHAAAAAKLLQSCPTLCDPIDGSPPVSPGPGIFPSKKTGVGCRFLLQFMKVKSESEVAQSCLTPSDPMDCSPPSSSVQAPPTYLCIYMFIQSIYASSRLVHVKPTHTFTERVSLS